MGVDETAVMRAIEAFYAAFGDGFTGPADFATEDWNHLDPLGGRTHSREETLAVVRAAHESFLANVIDTIESADVRFANEGVAVATVVSRTSPHPLPGDLVARSHRMISTFVVVRRAEGWKIMQDQNTFVAQDAPD
jgi:uncharacterized protein (TIGR02246 family)